MKTREEHLNWCVQRACEYLDAGDSKNAIASLISDLSKHPETKDHPGIKLGMGMLLIGQLKSVPEMRHFIAGFR